MTIGPLRRAFLLVKAENLTLLSFRTQIKGLTIQLAQCTAQKTGRSIAPEAQEEHMAFTRAFLKTMGLSEEQVQAIIDAHLEVVNPIKEQRDQFKTDAEKLPGVVQERDALRAELDKGGEDFQSKYESEHRAFEEFKAQTKAEAEQAKIKAEYRKLLTDSKIGEKRLDAIIRLTDFSKMKLDKDGNLTDVDKLKDEIKTDWGDYIQTAETKGAKVETPPYVGNAKMTREDIFKKDDHGRYVLSTEERQRAIAANPQAFQ